MFNREAYEPKKAKLELLLAALVSWRDMPLWGAGRTSGRRMMRMNQVLIKTCMHDPNSSWCTAQVIRTMLSRWFTHQSWLKQRCESRNSQISHLYFPGTLSPHRTSLTMTSTCQMIGADMKDALDSEP